MSQRVVICLVGVVAVSLSAVAQEAPGLMNYQGTLVLSGGTPAATGSYPLQFRIWDAADGGTVIWGPQIFDGAATTGHGALVAVVSGAFNVVLGPRDTSGRALVSAFDGSDRFLQVGVDDPVTKALTWLSPRQQILSAPFALKSVEAGNADTLDGHDTTYFTDVGNARSGTLSTGRFSAYDDLVDEARIGTKNGQVAAGIHNHDTAYVNEGQANSVTSGMITNGTVAAADLQDGAALVEIADDDGAGSGLDADYLDGQDSSFYRSASNINAGTLNNARFSAYSDLSAEGRIGAGADKVAAGDHMLHGASNTADGVDAGVGGGTDNAADGSFSYIGGGMDNYAKAAGATIGGGGAQPGSDNTGHRVYGYYGTIGGGFSNRAGVDDGQPATRSGATVGGGHVNVAAAAFATIGGGISNNASGESATIGGGRSNEAAADYSTVGGGLDNEASGKSSVIAGGRGNVAAAEGATIGGGGLLEGHPDTFGNHVFDRLGTIGGGLHNTVGVDDGDETNQSSGTVAGGFENEARGVCSTVGGGEHCVAGGSNATVPGGESNEASGYASFAAGRRAQAVHDGAFVWADSTNADFASTASKQFLVRASGGVGLGTNSPSGQLHVAETVAGGATLGNHVAIIDNRSTDSANGPDVLALRSNVSDPSAATNFITFFDADSAVGAIDGDGAGGIVFKSGSADFAEFLPKCDPAETLEPGDVIGVHADGVGRNTNGAHRVAVITTRPIVLGNDPGPEQEANYAPVAFLGQVPVKVGGPVRAGDYLIASGNDGTAVAAKSVTAEMLPMVVGQALESSDDAGVKKVLASVGLSRDELWSQALQERDGRIARLELELEALKSAVAALAAK